VFNFETLSADSCGDQLAKETAAVWTQDSNKLAIGLDFGSYDKTLKRCYLTKLGI
jgi:hypothetical protein